MRRDDSQLPAPARSDMALARGLAAHARLTGMRTVTLSPDGATVSDGFGRSLPATQGGAPVAGRADAVHSVLRLANTPPWETSRKPPEDELNEVDLGTLGTWHMSRDGDAVTLTAEKPGPTCVDALLSGPADAMADVRRLYGKPGVGIVVACVGTTRSREMAMALASELSSLGLPVALDMAVPARDAWRVGGDEAMASFDMPPGTPVRLTHLQGHAFEAVARRPGASGDARTVTVGEPGRHMHTHMGRLAEAQGERPVAYVSVELSPEDSKPRLRSWLSPGAAALLADPTPTPANAPWETLAARREGQAGRRRRPNTWHSTTEQVARAYVAREAPRGRVSGDTLFFHGPVMWALYRDNPIAAFVEGRDGETFMLKGRSVVHGTKGGTVSSAIGDVDQANGKRFPTLDVRGDMAPFLRWGDTGIEQAWARASRGKCEADMPRACTVDGPALATWLAAEMTKARVEQAEAERSRFPTVRLFNALNAQVRIIDTGVALDERLGLGIAPAGDREAVRATIAAATEADQARQAGIAERRAAKVAAAAPAGP